MRIFYRAMHSFFARCDDAPTLSEQRNSRCHDQPGSDRPVRFVSLYPSPINSDLQHNAVNTTNSAFNVDQGDLKIDFKATQKDNISYRFTRAYQNNPSFNSQVLLSNGYSTTPIYNTVGDWTRTIGNNLVNDARVGWSHITLNSGNSWASGVGQFGNTLGIGNGNPGNLDGLLALNFSNTAVSNIGAAERPRASMTTSGSSKMGELEPRTAQLQIWRSVVASDYQDLLRRQQRSTGSHGLRRKVYQLRHWRSGGDGGADFVLGLNYQYGRGVSTGKTWQQFSNVIGIYAQDTWRVTDRLTLNLGLRYDAHTPWAETNDQQANYNIATGNIDLAGKNGASRALYNGFYGGRDFQPRIGFAWTPAMLGRAHGDPRRVHNFVVSGRHRHEPSSDTQSTFHSGRNQRHLQQHFAAPDNTTDGIAGSASAASCDAPAYACYAQAFLRVWDPNVQPAIADQWNADCPTPICWKYHGPSWVCRAEGNSPDGAIRLCAETAASEFGLRHATLHGTQPLFRSQSNALQCVWATLLKTAKVLRFQAPSPMAT